jgi:hypothetical protein
MSSIARAVYESEDEKAKATAIAAAGTSAAIVNFSDDDAGRQALSRVIVRESAGTPECSITLVGD